MKTTITSQTFRNLALFTVFAYFSLNLTGQTTHDVTVSDFQFTPSTLTITAGDQVTWTNTDGSHNVNGNKSIFPSNPESFGNTVGEVWTYSFTFNTPGTYNYQCNPHAVMGMTGQIIVNPKQDPGPYMLTVNFTGMNPHVGQTLWLAVIDNETHKEIARVEQVVSQSFSIEAMGLEKGKSYHVDFFSDHNKNGVYDTPPTDHAWRSEVDNVSSNVVIDFAHNTTFTDIAWKNKLTVNFSGMTPHLNQMLTLYVKQADTNVNVDTLMVDPIASPAFNISSYKIKPGLSYHIDFFADHNKNGMYDAPPADHAWRIDLNNVLGDTTVNFVHNTKFTDILGPVSHKITVSSGKFTPAIQTITAGDTVIWTNIQGSHNVNGTQAKFPSNPESFGNDIGEGWTYKFVFTKPGTYDYQCDPHAIYGMVGKIIVNPNPATGPYTLTVNFTGMNPHIGQTLWLAVIDKATQTEIARVEQVVSQSFSIEVMGLEKGKSYHVDFFSDHNKNGVYDAPPTDHAWRSEVDNVSSNVTIDFAHNTTFTDIAWKYKLTVHFTGMTPHLGQTLTLFLVWADTGFYHDTVVISPVPAATFDINSYNIKPGFSYNIDFYADHNGNGVYNSPPVDHAWRLPLTNVLGDTIVHFAHNTNFTDILPATAIRADVETTGKIHLYPNPASQYIQLLVPSGYEAIRSVKVYSMTGSAVDEKAFSGNAELLRIDVSKYKKGVYFMEVNTGIRRDVLKFIKQ